MTPLDRLLPPEDRDEWTARVAAPIVVDEARTASVLLFRLGSEWFGLGADVVRGIAPHPTAHALPRGRAGIPLQLLNIEGEMIVGVALDALLGVPRTSGESTAAGAHGARTIVTTNLLAFVADEVHGIHRYRVDGLHPLPPMLGGATSPRTVGLLAWEGHQVARLRDAAILEAMEKALA